MPAAIPVVAAVAGAYIASRGAKSAAETQAAASDRAAEGSKYAADLQMQQYQQTREDQAPWRQAGQVALKDLVGGLAPGGEFTKNFTMADYQADPGYKFRIDQGEQAIERAAVARGSRYSGATLKALARFNSGLASDEYGKAYDRFNNDLSTRFNRLASVAGVGQTATAQTGQAGAAAAGAAGQLINAQGQMIQDAGTARASGYVGASNAVNGALGQISNYYTLQSLLPKTAPTGTASGSVANVLY